MKRIVYFSAAALALFAASGFAQTSADRNARQLILAGSTTDLTNTIKMKAPALASPYILTLPVDDGTPNQILQTDGSGILTWVSSAAGTVTNVTASAPLASSGGTTPNISLTGIVGAANGGTGLNTSAAANGTLLIGNGAGFTLSTLSTGSGISVVNAAGSITISNSGVLSVGATAPLSNTGTATAPVIALTGIVSAAKGGTGLDGSAAANGTLLIGNGAGYTLSTLSAGTGINVANAAGSITISTTNTMSYATAAISAGAVTIPANTAVVSITLNGGSNANTVTMPAGANGQVMYIYNDDETDTGSTAGPVIGTKQTATFVFAAGAWQRVAF